MAGHGEHSHSGQEMLRSVLPALSHTPKLFEQVYSGPALKGRTLLSGHMCAIPFLPSKTFGGWRVLHHAFCFLLVHLGVFMVSCSADIFYLLL